MHVFFEQALSFFFLEVFGQGNLNVDVASLGNIKLVWIIRQRNNINWSKIKRGRGFEQLCSSGCSSNTNEDEWSYGDEKNIKSGRTRAIMHNG